MELLEESQMKFLEKFTEKFLEEFSEGIPGKLPERASKSIPRTYCGEVLFFLERSEVMIVRPILVKDCEYSYHI